MNLQTLLETVTDGEEHGWATEFQWIEKHSPNDLNGFLEDVGEHGIQNPVLIGPDNRLWDGHHRVWAAQKLGLETIPVERITQ